MSDITWDDAIALIRQGIDTIARIRAEENGDSPNLFLTGWVIAYEIESREAIEQRVTIGGVIAPDDQSTHLSRGMAMAAVDHMRPGGINA